MLEIASFLSQVKSRRLGFHNMSLYSEPGQKNVKTICRKRVTASRGDEVELWPRAVPRTRNPRGHAALRDGEPTCGRVTWPSHSAAASFRYCSFSSFTRSGSLVPPFRVSFLPTDSIFHDLSISLSTWDLRNIKTSVVPKMI
ncbi:hypothetical protein QVD17_34932 [Tagetes erecta]|uniref:Uncharacterized protein n=1 Tax=Tagetes erecta TaxID=13708 RepID=A0AAD8NKQ5_TARER|nr:hypothetical protein QVD17_34932 [Tagetes erecta]